MKLTGTFNLSLSISLLLHSEDKFLSVRMLLEINEDLLTKHKFVDVWRREKAIENAKALELFVQRLDELDQIHSNVDRWHEIFRGELTLLSIFVSDRSKSISHFSSDYTTGILAGNVFDYGATQVQELLQSNKNFNLNDALAKIQTRPWLFDDFDGFIERLDRV